MAGSIQLAALSQLRPCETPAEPTGTPMWFTLEVEEEEEEEVEFGRPPKLMLIFGRSARSPSCHSFTFMLSTEPLFSEREEMNEHQVLKCCLMFEINHFYDASRRGWFCINVVIDHNWL